MRETVDTAYHELYAYTMGRPKFILQHVVDANMAQTLDRTRAGYKPMGAIFALAGLYLHCEKGFTGAQVQQASGLNSRTAGTSSLEFSRNTGSSDPVLLLWRRQPAPTFHAGNVLPAVLAVNVEAGLGVSHALMMR